MRKTIKRICCVAAALCFLLLAGCAGQTETSKDFDDFGLPVAEIPADYPEEVFSEGEVFHTDAGPIFYLRPEERESDYYLISSNPEAVEIAATNPRMIVIRSAGTAEITAYAVGGKERISSCTFQVKVDLVSLSMRENTLVLLSSGSRQLYVDSNPINASDYQVEWSSSNPEIASVSESGFVSAGKAGGETTVTVSSKQDSEIFAQCRIRVHEVAQTANGWVAKKIAMPTSDYLGLGNVEDGGLEVVTQAAPDWVNTGLIYSTEAYDSTSLFTFELDLPTGAFTNYVGVVLSTAENSGNGQANTNRATSFLFWIMPYSSSTGVRIVPVYKPGGQNYNYSTASTPEMIPENYPRDPGISAGDGFAMFTRNLKFEMLVSGSERFIRISDKRSPTTAPMEFKLDPKAADAFSEAGNHVYVTLQYEILSCDTDLMFSKIKQYGTLAA